MSNYPSSNDPYFPNNNSFENPSYQNQYFIQPEQINQNQINQILQKDQNDIKRQNTYPNYFDENFNINPEYLNINNIDNNNSNNINKNNNIIINENNIINNTKVSDFYLLNSKVDDNQIDNSNKGLFNDLNPVPLQNHEKKNNIDPNGN